MEVEVREGAQVSRKKDIREMANLVGNSAAHVALYPDQGLVEKEVVVYVTFASEVAARRTWNDLEMSEFRKAARRRAESEIRRRTTEEGLDRKAFEGLVPTAERYIDEFIEREMRRKK